MAFDVITPVAMGNAELTVGLATIRTTPASSRDFVKQIDIANNNSLSADVTVHLVPSGGSADSTNILIPAVEVPKNTVMSWNGVQVTNAGATIQASATVSDVTITISGGNAV
jgi:hypothetical protein